MVPRSISILILAVTGVVYGNQDERKLLFVERQCRAIDPSSTYFCPVNRYCLWGQLDGAEQNYLVKNLKYSQQTWEYDNSLNENIELISFDGLGQDEQIALTTVGFDEESHDCCHGHYQDYDWSDFDGVDYDGVKRAWGLLGYNQGTWDLGLATEFDDYFWDELSDLQRLLLQEELCYTRELWNGRKLSQWPDSAIIPGSSAVETDETPAPSPVLTSTLTESIEETESLSSLTPFLQTSNTTDKELTSVEETLEPTVVLTSFPTSQPSHVPSELSSTPSKSISSIPSKQASFAPQTAEPTVLFTSFPASQPSHAPSELSSTPTNSIPLISSEQVSSTPSSLEVAPTTKLPTTEFNLPSLKPSESESLVPSQQKTAPPSVLEILSSESPSEASNTPSIYPSFVSSTHPSQDLSSIPSSESSQMTTTFWPSFGLSMGQSFGSSFEQSFESSFPEDSFDIAKALSCGEKRPNTEYYCPSQRYCAWDIHNTTVKDWLENNIGYGRFTWNFYRINPYELTDIDILPPEIWRSIEAVGYDVDTHECCNSHYETYDWAEFDLYNSTEVKNALEIYGYDQNSWDNDLPLEYEDYDWEEFPEEIQFVLAEHLCYSRELWNEIPLEMWPEKSILPGSYPEDGFEEEIDTLPDSPDDKSTAFVKNLSLFSLSFIYSGTILCIMFITA